MKEKKTTQLTCRHAIYNQQQSATTSIIFDNAKRKL